MLEGDYFIFIFGTAIFACVIFLVVFASKIFFNYVDSKYQTKPNLGTYYLRHIGFAIFAATSIGLPSYYFLVPVLAVLEGSYREISEECQRAIILSVNLPEKLTSYSSNSEDVWNRLTTRTTVQKREITRKEICERLYVGNTVKYSSYLLNYFPNRTIGILPEMVNATVKINDEKFSIEISDGELENALSYMSSRAIYGYVTACRFKHPFITDWVSEGGRNSITLEFNKALFEKSKKFNSYEFFRDGVPIDISTISNDNVVQQFDSSGRSVEIQSGGLSRKKIVSEVISSNCK